MSTKKAKAEFEETAELEILFLLGKFAESINGKWSQLLKEWTSNLHDVTEVLEIFLVLSSGTSHEAANERRQETEEEVFLFLVPSETSSSTTEGSRETSIEAEAEVLLGTPVYTSSEASFET